MIPNIRSTQAIFFGLVCVGLLLAGIAWEARLLDQGWDTVAFFSGGSLFAVGMAFTVRDAQLKQTKALPSGASSVYTDGFDLGHGSKGDFLADVELLISAPALAVGQLANGSTMKYSVQHDTDPAFGTAVVLHTDVITQTGAGGVGAAAATQSVRLPVDVNRYVRIRVTNSAAADASAAAVTAELMS